MGESGVTSSIIPQTPRGMTLASILFKWGLVQGYLETEMNNRGNDNWVKLELPKLIKMTGLKFPEVTEIRELTGLSNDDIYNYLVTRDIAYTVYNYYYYHLWMLYDEASKIIIQPRIVKNLDMRIYYVYTKIIPLPFLAEILKLRGEDL